MVLLPKPQQTNKQTNKKNETSVLSFLGHENTVQSTQQATGGAMASEKVFLEVEIRPDGVDEWLQFGQNGASPRSAHIRPPGMGPPAPLLGLFALNSLCTATVLQLTPDTFDDELRASPCAPA